MEKMVAPPHLYHYTSMSGFYGIVSSGRIWASESRFLNDHTEYKHGVDIFEKVHSEMIREPRWSPFGMKFSNLADKVRATRVFVTSFTTRRDALSQWRGYSADGGVSIGFEHDRLRRIAKENYCHLSRCLYEEAEKKAALRDLYERMLSVFDDVDIRQTYLNNSVFPTNPGYREAEFFENELPHLLATFKHEAFDEEDEWRLTLVIRDTIGPNMNPSTIFCHRSTSTQIIPQFQLSLGCEPARATVDPAIVSVTIGPGSSREAQEDTVDGVRCFARHSEHGAKVIARHACIKASDAPYRTGHRST